MAEPMGDPAVFAVQKWVNDTYGKVAGFQPAPYNGKTGWSTVYALTRALQVELGITALADEFGSTTTAKYKQWGEMSLGNVPTDEKGKAIVKILKGAMYCKGYNPGKFDDVFDEKTKNAVVSLQKDAGLPVADGKVYDYIFKAFLTMDAYSLTPGGDEYVRQIQQDLNNKYYKTSGVQPTDGHYQRGTNKALVYGLQTEMGIAADSQTGSIGPATKNGLPILKVGSSGRFVTLFQYALYFNGYDSGSFSTTYNASIESAVKKFQEFTLLPQDGVANKSTWLSALVSTGDPDRKGKACDCITEVTLERGKALKAAGYETVGRYLVNVAGGINKKIQPGELKNIFDAGLSVFPIYQANGRQASSFSAEQGRLDAKAAYDAAKEYGFQDGTTIYFAVDFDAYGTDITDNILPHFKALNEKMVQLGGSYKVGVYGARNVCIQVSEKGYAKTSFVSGMSTGFSGNLGYPLPKNWAFDQISTIKVGSGSGLIEIDNNMKSNRDNGVSKIEKDQLSLTLQLLEMARSTYNDSLIEGESTSPGNWLLYKKHTNKSINSFDVYVYRKEISKEESAYTVAFRGSQQWNDFIVDFLQVGLNAGSYQVDEATKFVEKLIETERKWMSHLYITGHSLGGYLAQFVQSDIIDENLPWVESNAVTFNAPGFSSSINYLDVVYQAKVIKKLVNDKLKKYDDLIINHRIDQDIISRFGDDLGTVHVYDKYNKTIEDTKGRFDRIEYYHLPSRFKEVNLK
ncbi:MULTISPECIES: glycoside hydrolase domain-containing protein [unclassified Bacillus (in: firmicutes)]|uniref:glycoside hydrolase domain-containing protein n=1 Tax=unclassified Bacillus (in: firmicutes) TaxID=185979 RepID=UPI0008E35989|nr:MULTISPECIES: glycoside hydrolase domain-containing protein [unclassified Bacillus (in: firmicutes)]SFK04835.1 Peptidoglycan-binding (PGRP) domain of peptidoglycan hydrolases-containing protein [Bacillus sp. 71mf]SFT22715.1 Peptidoglycan-binding (PGRP) domain of peptidoglycan hydrolases-containing protein [Bacillus sp. 103mf]